MRRWWWLRLDFIKVPCIFVCHYLFLKMYNTEVHNKRLLLAGLSFQNKYTFYF